MTDQPEEKRRSPLRYFGGKRKIAGEIIKLMGDLTGVVEPFADREVSMILPVRTTMSEGDDNRIP
jgi:hypothetical protein